MPPKQRTRSLPFRPSENRMRRRGTTPRLLCKQQNGCFPFCLTIPITRHPGRLKTVGRNAPPIPL
ncbi:TPA: hypothetical protein ACFNMY_000848 [Neisseria bacilliformis]|jgi:hypothetical protein